jgi:hypothetical protein
VGPERFPNGPFFRSLRVISLAPAGNAADSHEYAIYLVGGSYDAGRKICVRRSVDHMACRDRRYYVNRHRTVRAQDAKNHFVDVKSLKRNSLTR